jgi:hypothetical protein
MGMQKRQKVNATMTGTRPEARKRLKEQRISFRCHGLGTGHKTVEQPNVPEQFEARIRCRKNARQPETNQELELPNQEVGRVSKSAFSGRQSAQYVAPSGTRIISTRRPSSPAPVLVRTSTREVSTLFFSPRYFFALSARCAANFCD